jgi:drug/metabolite transporter (DMT)-like permease
MKRGAGLGVLSLVTATVLWAGSFIALKLAFRQYSPMTVIFGRMAVAAVVFVFILPRTRGIQYRPGDYKPLGIMVLLEPCLYFLLEARALTLTSASQAGTIVALIPLMVAAGAGIFLKEKIDSRLIFGGFLAIVGAIWLSLSAEADTYSPRPALGNFLEFLAMICGAAFTVILKNMCRRYPPLFLTGLQAFAGSIFFFPLMWFIPPGPPSHLAAGPLLAIVYLGIFVTFGAYALFNTGVSRIPASQAAVFLNLIPVFTIFLGGVLLKETLTWPQYLACLLVIGGVFYSQSRGKPSETGVCE